VVGGRGVKTKVAVSQCYILFELDNDCFGAKMGLSVFTFSVVKCKKKVKL
jgi:hypothetical protein